jgi:hypothetical protein
MNFGIAIKLCVDCIKEKMDDNVNGGDKIRHLVHVIGQLTLTNGL